MRWQGQVGFTQLTREEVSAAESTSKYGKLKTTFEQYTEFLVSVTGDSVIIIMSDSYIYFL